MSIYVHCGSDGQEKGKYEGSKMTVNTHNDHMVEILGGCNVTVVAIHLLPGEAVYKEKEKEAS